MTFSATIPDGARAAMAERFFADARRAAEAALSRTRCEVRNYTIAGQHLRLRFAGEGLVRSIAPAFEHGRRAGGGEPHLTVELFDSVRSGVRLPQRPWSDDAFRPRLEIEGYTSGRFRAGVSMVGRSVNLLDTAQNHALYWIEDANAVPHYESGAPLLAILHWWMKERGRQLVHAGAVGREDGAVLLVGKGGSGKSTAALACLGSRLRYLADDYCLVTGGDAPRVFCAYATGKLHASNAFTPPGIEASHFNAAAPHEKRVFTLAAHFADSLLAEAPIRAVLLPSPSGETATTWAPLGAARALAAAAPSTVLQLPGAGGETFATLAAIMRRVPAFRLATGTDLAGIPVAIDALLREIS